MNLQANNTALKSKGCMWTLLLIIPIRDLGALFFEKITPKNANSAGKVSYCAQGLGKNAGTPVRKRNLQGI